MKRNTVPLYSQPAAFTVGPKGDAVKIEDKQLVVGDVAVNSNYKLGVEGDTYLDGELEVINDITVNALRIKSDYRLKANVAVLDEGFIVDKLKPVIYNKTKTGETEIGFLAHEVKEEFPYLVSGEKDGIGYQTVNYVGLIAVLVNEIQMLKKRINLMEMEGKDKK